MGIILWDNNLFTPLFYTLEALSWDACDYLFGNKHFEKPGVIDHNHAKLNVNQKLDIAIALVLSFPKSINYNAEDKGIGVI